MFISECLQLINSVLCEVLKDVHVGLEEADVRTNLEYYNALNPQHLLTNKRRRGKNSIV